MTMTFCSKLIMAVLLSLFSFSVAFAGTGQIFSPSGLPQSSTQSYTPPNPGNTPTVTFPTPPLPLGEGVLQSFPGSTIPLGNGTQKPAGATAQGSGTQQPLPAVIETNTIESFFQCNTPGTLANAKPSAKKKSSLGKVIWHTLDNLGVPMFVGKDNDLDPSLSQAYVLPSPATPIKNIVPAIPQKIPESELEGTDVSPNNDQTLPLHGIPSP
jgi:hypothetical protein